VKGEKGQIIEGDEKSGVAAALKNEFRNDRKKGAKLEDVHPSLQKNSLWFKVDRQWTGKVQRSQKKKNIRTNKHRAEYKKRKRYSPASLGPGDR